MPSVVEETGGVRAGDLGAPCRAEQSGAVFAAPCGPLVGDVVSGCCVGGEDFGDNEVRC